MTIDRVGPACRVAPAADAAAARLPPELVQRFAAELKRGGTPIPPRLSAADAALPGATTGYAARATSGPRAQPRGIPAHGGERADPRPTKRGDEPTDMAGLGQPLLSLPQAPALAVPLPVTPRVDPAAFADMLNQLWLREQHRSVREVRVRFGDAAWPVTGARLVRLADGSIEVEVLLDRHGRRGDAAALSAQLAASGLPVASLTFADGG